MGETHCSVFLFTQHGQHPFCLNSVPLGQSDGWMLRQNLVQTVTGSTHLRDLRSTQHSQQPGLPNLEPGGHFSGSGGAAHRTASQFGFFSTALDPGMGETHCSVFGFTQHGQHPFCLNSVPIGQSDGWMLRQSLVQTVTGSTHSLDVRSTQHSQHPGLPNLEPSGHFSGSGGAAHRTAAQFGFFSTALDTGRRTHFSDFGFTQHGQHPFVFNSVPVGHSDGSMALHKTVAHVMIGSTHFFDLRSIQHSQHPGLSNLEPCGH